MMTPSLLATNDGTKLYVQHYPSTVTPAKLHLVIVHGYMEHAGRYQSLAEYCCQHNFAVTAFDLRGHGRSSGQRGYVHDANTYFTDLDLVMAQAGAGANADAPPIVLLGHSLGGLLALAYATRRRLPLAGLVVSNPYLAATISQNKFIHWFGMLTGRFVPRLSLPYTLQVTDLTHDLAMQQAHQQDPLIFRWVNSAWYRAISQTQDELLSEVESGLVINAPALFMISPKDRISHPDCTLRVAKAVRSPKVDIWHHDHEGHEIFQERNRAQTIAAVTHWLLEHCLLR